MYCVKWTRKTGDINNSKWMAKSKIVAIFYLNIWSLKYFRCKVLSQLKSATKLFQNHVAIISSIWVLWYITMTIDLCAFVRDIKRTSTKLLSKEAASVCKRLTSVCTSLWRLSHKISIWAKSTMSKLNITQINFVVS